ncbi:MAG TPA: histidinol-phosphate transaminase, partial [Solirubrobacteraceae bacterium]|nr:histidinol-phosphate transaminase [Solirubrobacteraceae bacterium]
MALEFAGKVRRIPVYPAADGYASEGPIAKMASNESPYPPIPAVVEAAAKALAGANRYPDP